MKIFDPENVCLSDSGIFSILRNYNISKYIRCKKKIIIIIVVNQIVKFYFRDFVLKDGNVWVKYRCYIKTCIQFFKYILVRSSKIRQILTVFPLELEIYKFNGLPDFRLLNCLKLIGQILF